MAFEIGMQPFPFLPFFWQALSIGKVFQTVSKERILAHGWKGGISPLPSHAGAFYIQHSFFGRYRGLKAGGIFSREGKGPSSSSAFVPVGNKASGRSGGGGGWHKNFTFLPFLVGRSVGGPAWASCIIILEAEGE